MARQRGPQQQAGPNSEARPKSGLTASVLTVLAALVVSLTALEVGVRALDGIGFGLRNYVADRLSLLASAYPSVYDPQLGYVPRPDYDGTANAWNTRVSIDSASLRRNAPGRPVSKPAAVVAVGDSYTFGDEVSDADTWPAQLEGLLGQPVANGGVFGYGLDQAVLRAERLVPEYRPWSLVVSFIYGDVRRTQLVQRTGVEKPYFQVVDGQLVLRNVPPSPNRPRIEQMGLVRTVLGYSYLADWTARRLAVTDWWYGGGFPQVQAHDDGPQVACLLMRRLRALQDASSARVLVVAQYIPRNFTTPEDPKSVEELSGSARLLDCAAKAGLDVLDTLPALQARYRASPSGFLGQYFVQAHMSAAGNRLVAEHVADALARAHNGG